MDQLDETLIPIVGMSIPIIAMLIALAIARAAFKHRTERDQMEHQERMLAIEKGAPLPPVTVPPEKGRNPYIWGFILIGVGLAMMVAMGIEGDEDWGWGMLFLLMGVGILTANLLFLRDRKRKELDYSTVPPRESTLP